METENDASIVRFLCAGSISFDLTFRVDRMPREHEKLRCETAHQSCGGSAANTARWLARRGHHVEFAGAVGNDPLGDVCLEALRHDHVGTLGVTRLNESETGVATIFIHDDEKRMVTSRGANGAFRFSPSIGECVAASSHVHLSLSDQGVAMRLLECAKECGATTSVDFNGRPSAERVPLCDICFMNYDELTSWLGEVDPIAAWVDRFGHTPSLLVVTRASRGATAVARGEQIDAAARAVDVVDRTGAGDAFNAGFLHAWKGGRTIKASLESGIEWATHAIAGLGAVPRAPWPRGLEPGSSA